ncbi:MAG: UDP-3-O-(3-hydroxymyristoyl)glucosamine N-acyltransferase [Halanaerobiaceae bacterium]|nr:UDP-3-O-(3-hydroxymyristoyl)glucosamine N-acyltransferase [Halanaerobiaceae bacterium]
MINTLRVVTLIVNNQKDLYTIAELADMVGGEVIGDLDLEIRGAAGVKEAGRKQITFAENEKVLRLAEESEAAAIIVAQNITGCKKTIIRVKNPRLAYAIVSSLFVPDVFYKSGRAPSAVISESAEIGQNVSIHPMVVIEDDVVIGDNSILAPGVFVGKGSRIGSNTIIHPNVVIEYNSIIGSNVIIHGGTVIGSDGYGFVSTEEGHYKIPQTGNVIIEDDVEIGANVTIDRGTSGPTVIGKGTKIDNLVQIGHNVRIGPECLIIAQVGIAGSTELGKRVVLAGKTGVVGHIKIADNTTVAAMSTVTKSIPPASFYSGNPAQSHKDELKEQAALRKLPLLIKTIKEMEKRIRILESELQNESQNFNN